jgi:hypothetical protein
VPTGSLLPDIAAATVTPGSDACSNNVSSSQYVPVKDTRLGDGYISLMKAKKKVMMMMTTTTMMTRQW